MNVNAVELVPLGAALVLLLHGAFSDASIWSGVIPVLQDAGLDVVAPANPLRGLATDAAYIASVAREIDGPVLLVGHDYGGAVITVAGEQLTNAVGLVYVAAYAPDCGESALDLLGRFPGSLLLPALHPAAALDPQGQPGIELYVRADSFSPILASDLPARTTAVLAAAQRPIAADALAERALGAAWRVQPCWYAVATEDQAVPPEVQRFMARRANARTIEHSGSHAITLSHPAAIAALIRSAATGRSFEQDQGGDDHGHGA